MSAEKVVRMATAGGAAALGMEKTTGNIDTTIVNGEIVYRKGVFSCGIDEAELSREVMSEIKKIICTEPPAEAGHGREWILEEDL